MEEILNSINGVTVMMSEISSASAEQTAVIEQVNKTIGQMDDVTQQNAALVEQAAAAAMSMEEQALSLSDAVSQFKLDEASNNKSQFSPLQKQSGVERAEANKNPRNSGSNSSSQPSNDAWEEF